MRTPVLCLVVSMCLPLLLAGCVSQQQIQLDCLVPAKLTVPHGSQIAVQSNVGGATAGTLKKEFTKSLARHGLSRKVGGGAASCYLVIDELKLRLNKSGERHEPLHMNESQLNLLNERRMQRTYMAPTDTELYARVSLVSDSKVLWSRCHSVIVATPPYTRPSLQKVCRLLVDEVVNDLMPQHEPYTVQVKLKNAPAELAEAVRACRKKDWEAALMFARQAHRLNPQAAEPVYLIGLLARQYGDYPAATALFKKAYALEPDARYLEAQLQNTELYRIEFAARHAVE